MDNLDLLPDTIERVRNWYFYGNIPGEYQAAYMDTLFDGVEEYLVVIIQKRRELYKVVDLTPERSIHNFRIVGNVGIGNEFFSVGTELRLCRADS